MLGQAEAEQAGAAVGRVAEAGLVAAAERPQGRLGHPADRQRRRARQEVIEHVCEQGETGRSLIRRGRPVGERPARPSRVPGDAVPERDIGASAERAPDDRRRQLAVEGAVRV